MLDRTGSTDLPDLLEFANAQFLELRYYDDALRKAIDSTYDEIDKATEPGSRGKAKTFRKVRNELMEVMADMSVLTSNVDNALQVTEDVFTPASTPGTCIFCGLTYGGKISTPN